MLVRIALFLVCVPTLILSLTCDEFIYSVIKTVSDKKTKKSHAYTKQEQAFLFFSSNKTSFIMGYGDKESCDQEADMKYFTAVAAIRHGSSGRWHETGHGVCLPKECNDPKYIDDQKLLNDLFTFKDWHTVNKGLKLHLYDATKSMHPKTWVYYFSVSLFLSVILLAIASTIIVHNAKKKAKILKLPTFKPAGSKIFWLYESFDLKASIISLYQTAQEQKLNQNIAIFGFLRIFTSWWVIFYHTHDPYEVTAKSVVTFDSGFHHTKYTHRFWYSGDLTVEYFFVMTGFLSAYILIPKLAKQGLGFLSYLTIIKHRFLRIWPVLMFAFLFWWQIIPRAFSGPMWFHFDYRVGYCNDLWWEKVLLIENITNYYTFKAVGNYCMIVTWYIPTEFQIYLVAVLAIAVFAKYRRIGYLLFTLLIIQSLGMGLYNCLKHSLVFPNADSNLLWHYFRMTPYTRWYALFIGVIWGALYYEYNKLNKKNIFYLFEKSFVVSHLSTIFGLVINGFVIFYPWESASHSIKSVWYPLRVFFISVGITLVFMPLVSNRDFYIKRFMNLRLFQVVGKCSFMTYLFADSLIYVLAFAFPTPLLGFSSLAMILFVTKAFLLAQPVAFAAHLFIEKPLLNIEHYLSKPKATPPVRQEKQPNQEEEEKIAVEISETDADTARMLKVLEKEREVPVKWNTFLAKFRSLLKIYNS